MLNRLKFPSLAYMMMHLTVYETHQEIFCLLTTTTPVMLVGFKPEHALLATPVAAPLLIYPGRRPICINGHLIKTRNKLRLELRPLGYGCAGFPTQ